VVANAGTQELRIFDSNGALLSRFGRRGKGPGEFERLGWVGHSGDTAFVFDGASNRLSTIRLGESPLLLDGLNVTSDGGKGRYSITGRLADGRWLATTGIQPTFDGPPGVHRLPGYAGLIPITGDGQVDWLAEQPSGAIFVYNPTGDVANAAVGVIAFTPWFHAAAAGSNFWYGESGADSLIRLDTRTGERTVVRLPFPAAAPSPAAIAALRAEALGQARFPADSGYAEAKHSGRYLPKQLPYFGGLRATSNGELWVPEYSEQPPAPTRHLVLNETGVALAWVTMPAGVRLLDAGADYIIGVHSDLDGIEAVRVYRLSRNQ
ncbi:MAG: hypothetical protein SGI84_12630, partial [Gemmatimonadota bacterium]|nr:hypothetical protein [Gemmatimonadota bacterium]